MSTEQKTKRYRVTIPIAGAVYVEVTVPADAGSDEIYEAACETYNDAPMEHELEWEFFQEISSGTVLHCSTNEWSKERIADE